MATVFADHKKYAICNYVMILATLGFCIATLAAEWISYKEGTVSLWQKCVRNLNETDCNGNHPTVCHATATTGPVWLEVCRTMACFALVLYISIYYVVKQCQNCDTQSFLGQLKARLPQICYFLSGFLLLSAAFLYHLNFEDYYSKDEKLKDVKPLFGFYVAYIGGVISVVNCIFLSSKIDTGFKTFIKSKFTCLHRNNNSTRANAETGQGVEVRSRFTVFISAVKTCGEKIKRKKNSEDINTGTNTTSQASCADRGIQIHSNLPRVRTEHTGRQTVVSVVSQSDQAPDNTPGQNRNQNKAQSSVFVVGNQAGYLSPSSSRSASVASISHLALEVRSLSGEGEDRDMASSSNSTSNPLQQLGVPQEQNAAAVNLDRGEASSNSLTYADYDDGPDAAPPSYEEVMRSISNC